MSEDQPDPRVEDALQIAQRALAKANDLEGDIEDQRQEIAELREDLTATQLRLSEMDEDRDYASLTLDEKIGMVREHAFEKALAKGGKTTLDYDDIMWHVFEGEPGTKHCYKLMRLAAGTGDDAQGDIREGAIGFVVRDPDNDARHLAVNADLAQQNVALFPENKAATEGGR